MESQSLTDYLDATAHKGRIPPSAEIVYLLMSIATALDSAHQRGEIHGALKPDVIWLDTSRATSSSLGEPTLRNFGMYQGQDPHSLSLNDVSYIAPEVAQGQPATGRSDLYSLGVILYELCTGALPFQGETSNDVLMQHIHSAPISPALINPHIRPALTAVIMRSLARDPAARFSSATALATAAAKATDVSMPESTSHAEAPTFITPSPVSTINDPNTPTYLLPPKSSQSGPLPVASSSSPSLPQPPVVPSITPVFPTGGVPRIQPPMNAAPVSQQASGPHPVLSMNRPPVSQQASGPHPVLSTSGTMPATPAYQQAAESRLVGSTSGPMPVTPPVSPPPRPSQRPLTSFFASASSTRRRYISVLAALALLVIAVLLGAVVLTYFVFTPASPPSSSIVGHAFFTSSGLISTANNQGTTDGLRISLQNINNPQPGKSYYGWLTSTGTDLPVALGPLSVNHGQITTTYNDPNHNNLLAHYDRFLITEESANQPPTNPSLDVVHDWIYSATFSTVPSQTDPNHYAVLDHLRHLLAADPKLAKVNLQGGLSVWLYRNTTKILEAAGSATDTRRGCTTGTTGGCDTGLILRQVARILDYLDGAQYVQTESIPSNIQGDQLLIDPNIAKVSLLEFDPVNQQPPGYLEHIGRHLQELTQAPEVTPGQRTLANSINQDINNVQGWLDAVHADASKLIHMSPDDLVTSDGLSTLNHLFAQADYAFVGQINPNTGKVKEGAVQIYYDIQTLATFDVAPCTINNGQSSCAQGGNG